MKPLPHYSLCLQEGDDDDGVHPRRFLRLPSGQLLAYGGDQGNVTCLVPGSNTDKPTFVIAKQSDDAVRSMAVSHDGKRIAVGNDMGSTQIFTYDDYDVAQREVHPYVKKAIERHTNKKARNSDDLMMSQDLDFEEEDEYFQGPSFSTSVRDLVFLPNTEDGDYRLAVATEEGMCIVNATNFKKMCDSPHLLEREAKEHHDNSGIRGLSINDAGDTMASLAMDGRLCLWDVKDMKLLDREDSICVTKKDVGEMHDGDPLDRACRPMMYRNNIVATPGRLFPYLRVAETANENTTFHHVDESLFEEASDNGHIESIVAMLFASEDILVTSGRDSRVVFWQAQEKDGNDSSTGTFLKKAWKVGDKYQLIAPATEFIMHENKLWAACVNGRCHVLDISKFLKSRNTAHVNGNGATFPKRISKKDGDKNADDDDDVDFGGSPNTKAPKGVRFVDDEADEEDEKPVEEKKAEHDDNLDAFPSSRDGTNMEDDDFVTKGSDHRVKSRYYDSSRLVRKVEPQEAFSPSETNPLNENELRRFLCWNHIGCATLLDGEDDVNTIDIHFTDAAFKRSISFSDDVGLVLGSIGEDGGIFASGLQDNTDDDDGNDIDDLDDLKMSERTKEAVRRDRMKSRKNNDDSEPKGSQVLFWKFDSIESKRDSTWSLSLPDGEEALGVGCGEGWSAVMTR
jgi:WD40 repeat protein